MSSYTVNNLQSTNLVDETDKTKKVRFNLSNISSGNTRTINVPDSDFDMVGRATAQELENKTIDGSKNTLSNIGNTALSSGIDAAKIGNGSVTNAEFQRIGNLTSNAVGESDPQVISNKEFVDSSTMFRDNVDSTKKGQFDLSGVTTGNIRKYDLPDADTRLVGHNNSETLTNKVINATSNTLSNISNTEIKSLAGIDATKIADGSVNNTRFQHLKNVTSDIQSQINNHTHTPSEVGLSNVPNLKMNLNASVAPGVNDDSSAGYSVGSRWVDTVSNEEYVCTDPSTGIAIWQNTTANGGGAGEANTMANVGLSGQGLFKEKAGVQLRLKNIGAGSSRVTVTNNTGQDTVDIDIDESVININNLTGAPNGTVLGANDIQTLTNKTISATSNTITGLTKSDVGLSNVQNLKVNLNAVTNPSSSNDSSSGYSIGSRWVNTSTNKEYVCTNASVGAANWVETTSTGGGGSSTLAGLTDTTISTPAKGSMLIYNGSQWIDVGVGTNGQILVADSSKVSGFRWADFINSTIGFMAYAPNSVTITTTHTIINSTVVKNTGQFSINGGDITVNHTGAFLVSYTITCQGSANNSNNEMSSKAFIERDTGSGYNQMVRTQTFIHHSSRTTDTQSGTNVSLIDFNAGDKIRVRVNHYDGTQDPVTVSNCCNIAIACIDNFGPQAGASSIDLRVNGTAVTGGPFSIMNLVNGTASQNGSNPSQVDIRSGPPWYGSSATDPTGSFTNGAMYFNTTIGQMMYFDVSRGKWLSCSIYTDGSGANGNTVAGAFYKRYAGMTLGTNTGSYVPKGTIVAIGFGTDNATTHTYEILNNGVVVASLASGGATTAYSDTINANITGGKLSSRNASGSNTTTNFQGTIWYRLRA